MADTVKTDCVGALASRRGLIAPVRLRNCNATTSLREDAGKVALLASPLSSSTNRTEFRHDHNNGSATSSQWRRRPELFATLDAVKGAPEIAQFQFRATNEWISGTHNRTTIQGFYGAGQEDTSGRSRSATSGSPGGPVGSNQGPTPVEFLLHAIAACLTAGLANIAAARGITLRRVSSTVEGDIDLLGILGLSDVFATATGRSVCTSTSTVTRRRNS